ncbi:MAG: ester cyclase [Rhizomicrobium sp.]
MLRIVFAAVLAYGLIPCAATAATPQPHPGEFGRAVVGAEAERHIATFDTLDFVVFSKQEWGRLHESHAENIIVSWPDGHDTHGIERHIQDLKQLFVHAPDTRIEVHPIRIANGEWTAVTGIMKGTFTRPMHLADGTVIQPTGRAFELPMATVAHWSKGRMDHEWLYWDNQTYMRQLGIAK